MYKKTNALPSRLEKADVQTWLTKHNVAWSNDMLKAELLELSRTHRPLPTYVVDETLYVAFTHQPRFHPDLNRGLYRERVGVILSAPIKSYHVDHRVDRGKILAAKKFSPINTIASTIGTIALDHMTS